MKAIHQLPSVLLCMLCLTACKNYEQLVYVTPTHGDITREQGFYVYENDTIKLVYSFWHERGVMAFMIWNKASVPIYIDWKKSSFVNRDRRIQYYTGKTTSNFTATSRSSGFSYNFAFSKYLTTSSSSTKMSGIGTTVKEERYTFIPPKSYIVKEFSTLMGNIGHFSISDRHTAEKEIKGAHVWESIPTKQLWFRNFLTYSTSEEFTKEQYADNEFSIDKVLTMKKKDFFGDQNDDPYSSRWYSPCRFYITDLKREDVDESYSYKEATQ